MEIITDKEYKEYKEQLDQENYQKYQNKFRQWGQNMGSQEENDNKKRKIKYQKRNGINNIIKEPLESVSMLKMLQIFLKDLKCTAIRERKSRNKS